VIVIKRRLTYYYNDEFVHSAYPSRARPGSTCVLPTISSVDIGGSLITKPTLHSASSIVGILVSMWEFYKDQPVA
jgi:hypothetical protein